MGTGCAYHPVKLIRKKPPRDLCAAASIVYFRRIENHYEFVCIEYSGMAARKNAVMHFFHRALLSLACFSMSYASRVIGPIAADQYR
jgi:hypothetical protein